MSKREIIMCSLQSSVGDHGEQCQMTTWLDKHPKLCVGALITLKDYEPDTVWLVTNVYDSPITHYSADFDWHRKWDNNI